ncbi:hypothetical protein BDE36_3451 [Arcticibacter tournemirensis]|nr:hypothetical protein BDE36_3451 [Arcticibacter tournemirensis]
MENDLKQRIFYPGLYRKLTVYMPPAIRPPVKIDKRDDLVSKELPGISQSETNEQRLPDKNGDHMNSEAGGFLDCDFLNLLINSQKNQLI